MTLAEARQIAEACRQEFYPPTNPVVLMQAALTIYHTNGVDDDVADIVDWLNTVIKGNHVPVAAGSR